MNENTDQVLEDLADMIAGCVDRAAGLRVMRAGLLSSLLRLDGAVRALHALDVKLDDLPRMALGDGVGVISTAHQSTDLVAALDELRDLARDGMPDAYPLFGRMSALLEVLDACVRHARALRRDD